MSLKKPATIPAFRQVLALSLCSVGLALLNGCASVTKGTSQSISFEVSPPSASCVLSREGDGELGKFSGSGNSVTVKKARKDIVVVCSAPGYEPKKQWLESSTDKTALAGIAIDGGLTDMVTGAMWVYPDKVELSLAPVKPTKTNRSDSLASNQPEANQIGKPSEFNEQALTPQQPPATATSVSASPQTTIASVDVPRPSTSANSVTSVTHPPSTLPTPVATPQVPSPSTASSGVKPQVQAELASSHSPSSTKRALVIGNNRYTTVPSLDNATTDADSFAKTLASFGYQVSHHKDLKERDFKKVLREFNAQLRGGDEVVFFYAGHGVQLDGQNFLLPTDVGSSTAEQVRDESIPLQRVLDDFNRQKARFTLAVVDACRDNPFAGRTRSSISRGLAPTSVATGQIIIFSAGAGQQALDRLGDNDKDPNGLFTRVFLKKVKESDSTIDRVIREVRREVAETARKVGHEQVPAIYDQAIGDFYFKAARN